MTRPSASSPTVTALGSRAALIAASVAGVLLWAGTSALTGRREAWDASVYWTVAYPAGLVLAAIVGYLAPEQAWRWGAVLMLVQAVAMAAMARDFSLLPLGLILFGVLAVPPMFAAWLAGRYRGRQSRR